MTVKLKTFADLARLKPVTPVANKRLTTQPKDGDEQAPMPTINDKDYGWFKDGRAAYI